MTDDWRSGRHLRPGAFSEQPKAMVAGNPGNDRGHQRPNLRVAKGGPSGVNTAALPNTMARMQANPVSFDEHVHVAEHVAALVVNPVPTAMLITPEPSFDRPVLLVIVGELEVTENVSVLSPSLTTPDTMYSLDAAALPVTPVANGLPALTAAPTWLTSTEEKPSVRSSALNEIAQFVAMRVCDTVIVGFVPAPAVIGATYTRKPMVFEALT